MGDDELTALVLSEHQAVKLGRPDWCDPRHDIAAYALADGRTKAVAARAAGISRQTLYDWLGRDDFREYVDRWSLRHGLMTQAERSREINRLWHKMRRQPIELRMKRHDEVDLIRVAAEQGVEEGRLPLAAQDARAVFIGTQINVGTLDGSVMSAAEPPEPDGEVVEGETRELEDGSSGPGG